MTIQSAFVHNVLISAGVCVFSLATATAAMADCPDVSQNGQSITTDANQAYTPQRYSVTAGGSVDLGTCSSVPGIGFVSNSPDFTIIYSGMGTGRALEFRVEASCDAVLLVNTATGQLAYNDDANGTNPALRISGAPDGAYDVWVGTFGSSTCSATLIAETF